MKHWPILDLRLRTSRLELRLPSFDDLDQLAERAFEGVHEPSEMPFSTPWTDAEPAERAQGTVLHVLGQLSAWTPAKWSCPFITVRREDGLVLGMQLIGAKDFAITAEVRTGSWIALAHHGHGYGTEQRAAVLHLAFAGLGAASARSEAYVSNPASLAVSRKLGYVEDGTETAVRRRERTVQQRVLLTREAWERHRTIEVEIEGLERCLPLFGVKIS